MFAFPRPKQDASQREFALYRSALLIEAISVLRLDEYAMDALVKAQRYEMTRADRLLAD